MTAFKKMCRVIIWAALFAVLAAASPAAFAGGNAETADGENAAAYITDGFYKYKITDGGRQCEIAAYTGAEESPVLPSQVKNIPVTAVGEGVFRGNTVIKSIDLGSIESVGCFAFEGCTALEKIVFPNTLTHIGVSAFEGCTALNKIILPDSLREISSAAFKNAGLKSINTGDGVLNIRTSAFEGNARLVDLYIGKGVTELGASAFGGCTQLRGVILPASLVHFDPYTFSGCENLGLISVARGSTAYISKDGAVYSADGKKLVTLAVPRKNAGFNIAAGTETVGAGAFELAGAIKRIGFPATLKNIEDRALDGTAWYASQKNGAVYAGKVLYGAKGDVSSLRVANGTVSVADGAFCNKAIKTVSLPASLAFIGADAFSGTALVKIKLPSGLKTVGSGAFADNAYLKNISLPAGLVQIGSGAFAGCTALEKVSIPDKVSVVSRDLFAGCVSLGSVDLGQAETVCENAFGGCGALETLTLPACLKSIAPGAFAGCISLKEINTDEQNESYHSVNGVVFASGSGAFDELAFYPAGRAGEYTVPDGTKVIADKAFYDCDALTAVHFGGSGVTAIGEESFFDCDMLETADIPENAETVGRLAFASCDKLQKVTFYTQKTDCAPDAFEGCAEVAFYGSVPGAANALPVIAAVIGTVAAAAVIYIILRKRKIQITDG